MNFVHKKYLKNPCSIDKRIYLLEKYDQNCPGQLSKTTKYYLHHFEDNRNNKWHQWL